MEHFLFSGKILDTIRTPSTFTLFCQRPFSSITWPNHSNKMPFHERTRNSSVAGRQQDQCPRARGGWEKVISYLIWPRQCITRLICWLTGASLRADQPGKYGLTRWKTFLVKFWLHGYHFVQTATTWLDCVIRV